MFCGPSLKSFLVFWLLFGLPVPFMFSTFGILEINSTNLPFSKIFIQAGHLKEACFEQAVIYILQQFPFQLKAWQVKRTFLFKALKRDNTPWFKICKFQLYQNSTSDVIYFNDWKINVLCVCVWVCVRGTEGATPVSMSQITGLMWTCLNLQAAPFIIFLADREALQSAIK